MLSQQKMGTSLVYRGSRGSTSPMKRSSSVASSTLTRASSSSSVDLADLFRQGSDIQSPQSSLRSLQSSHAELESISQEQSAPLKYSTPSKSGSAQTKLTVPLLEGIFFLVTFLKVDLLLNVAISILENNLYYFPFLLHFSFIKELVKKDEGIVPRSTAGITDNKPSEPPVTSQTPDNDCPAVGNDVSDVFNQASTPETVVTTTTEEPDDYGFFADFVDETITSVDPLGDPFQSLLKRSQNSCLSSLCVLEEEAEEEDG